MKILILKDGTLWRWTLISRTRRSVGVAMTRADAFKAAWGAL